MVTGESIFTELLLERVQTLTVAVEGVVDVVAGRLLRPQRRFGLPQGVAAALLRQRRLIFGIFRQAALLQRRS